MKIAIFGAGEMGRAVAQYFLSQSSTRQVTLYDIDAFQLTYSYESLKKVINVEKLKLIFSGDKSHIIATCQLAFICIPWAVQSDIIDLIAFHDVLTVILSRPPYNELDSLTSLLKIMSKPVIIGCGLEPGLTEVMSRYYASKLERLDELHLKCGGVTTVPASNVFGYKALFGTCYLPISNRQTFTVIGRQLISVPRFSGIEMIHYPDVGQLEAWHDGMVPWLYQYPEIATAHIVTQKTLRWPGFADVVSKLNWLGLLSEEEIDIGGFHISPKKFLDRLYCSETRLGEEDNVTLLSITTHGLKDGLNETNRVELRAPAKPEFGLNSLAFLTGYTASITGLLALDDPRGCHGVVTPECFLEENQVELLINQLITYGVELKRFVTREINYV